MTSESEKNGQSDPVVLLFFGKACCGSHPLGLGYVVSPVLLPVTLRRRETFISIFYSSFYGLKLHTLFFPDI